jgi:hypothetical protein
MNNKRSVVILALAIACILIFSNLFRDKTTADSSSMENVIGSWNAEATVEAAGATFPALLTFGVGGTVIADEPPLPGETSGHGNWISKSDDEVAFTFVALYGAEDAAYTGNLKVVGTLQYDSSADSWQGPFKIDVFDADGQMTFTDQGTFSLTRIAVESLD